MMTRIEHLFDPETVQRVYARIDRERRENEAMRSADKTAVGSVVSLSAYRQRMNEKSGVVS